MKEADVIIGANFGDEGKGLVTDFRCAPHGGDAVVVRFNGGAQAGHTVVAPDGRRHVFSHFSSGSFTGAATFLSRFFVCNPLLFAREYASLKENRVTFDVFADERAPVTTPYDMMINQIAEEARGDGRHGSCGVGFGETIGRTENGAYSLYCKDLSDAAALRARLRAIREDWLPSRLGALGLSGVPESWKERVFSDGVLEKFMEDTEFFNEKARVVAGSFIGGSRKKIVFEGAQGLLLDQDHEFFPHVTRSKTGIGNVLELAGEAGIDSLRVTYVTRGYMTRHGAGPLPHELPHPPCAGVRDQTNILNPYQGHLRFGWLDADRMAKTVAADLAGRKSRVRVRHGLAVTCLDQMDESVTLACEGGLKGLSTRDLPQKLAAATEASFVLESRGPARNNIADG